MESRSKSRGRSIFSLLFCCFPIQKISQFPEGSKHTILPKESGTVSKSNLPQVLQFQYSRIPDTWLLPEIEKWVAGRFCLVIDLDETLIHSSFKPIDNADFTVPLQIEGMTQQYADPVTDLLDKWGVFRARLFRESCIFHQGSYVKDLSRLGRDLNKIIIIDNSPASYIFHPNNAVPVTSWFDDLSDTELLRLIPAFEGLSQAENVYAGLGQLKSS